MVPYEEKLMNNSSSQENAFVHDCLWVKILPKKRNEIPGDNVILTFSLSLILNTKWYSPDFNFVSCWGIWIAVYVESDSVWNFDVRALTDMDACHKPSSHEGIFLS